MTLLVTKDPTPNLHEATCVPPHVQMMEIIKGIHNQLKDLDRNISRISESISRAVEDGIEQNDVRSGSLTLTTMEQKFNNFSEKTMKKINEKFMATLSLLPPAILDEFGSDIATDGADIVQMDRDSQQELSENRRQYNVYVNQGKFCDVPQGWKFPKCTLIEGWSF